METIRYAMMIFMIFALSENAIEIANKLDWFPMVCAIITVFLYCVLRYMDDKKGGKR